MKIKQMENLKLVIWRLRNDMILDRSFDTGLVSSEVSLTSEEKVHLYPWLATILMIVSQ